MKPNGPGYWQLVRWVEQREHNPFMGKVIIGYGRIAIDQREVEMYPTCSPYFTAHLDTYERYGVCDWVVTHLPSGFRSMRGLPSLRVAQLCAAVIAALPLDWQNITSKSDDPKCLATLVGRELHEWVTTWSDLRPPTAPTYAQLEERDRPGYVKEVLAEGGLNVHVD